jgi:hypothetical protein
VQELEHVGFIPLAATTTPDVPDLFRKILRQHGDIDEKATNYLPAEEATHELEREVYSAPIQFHLSCVHCVLPFIQVVASRRQ